MKTKRLIWQLYPSYLIVVFACIFVLGWYFIMSFSKFQIRQAKAELVAAARIARSSLIDKPEPMQPAAAQELCMRFGKASGYRFTVVLPSGRVVGDSDEQPEAMDNHAHRPEIAEALKGSVGASKRYSRTVRTSMLYVAAPIIRQGDQLGVVRCSLPLSEIDQALARMRTRLIWFALLLAMLASLATVLSTVRISAPLSRISRHSVEFGKGQTDQKLPASKIAEIDTLSRSINEMADHLHERIDTVVRQRDEQNVLFACMSESVLAVDNEQRVIRINAAARESLGIAAEDPRGKTVSQLVRHSELLDIIDKTINSESIVEGSIVTNDQKTCLQVHGSRLVGADGKMIGALVVLNDVTQLRNLELMRKDFVANVSHELKTPITSIRGFLDTLMDTADTDQTDRDRFMEIISEQVKRLQWIVEDLLTFSRLEHEIGKGEVELKECSIYPVLKNSVNVCSSKARSKDIDIEIDADRKSRAKISIQLLEQAVTNLVDNAIKYSGEGTRIDLSLDKIDGEIAIRVKDRGMGIPHAHQSRIFERFYCVDKSRSRELGGTGLGLAIVKHVAIAHGGRVEVDSTVGKGSTFSIIIPS